MDGERVSVLIPVYNCAPYLGKAIRSALAQTRPAAEIVIVDDGSTDDTPKVIRSFGDAVTCLRQDNQGVAHARNKGAAAATGEWFLFLDADDLLEPNALEWLLDAAHKADCDVAYGDKLVISQKGKVIKRARHRDCTGPIPAAARACFGGAAFEPAGAIVRADLFRKVGGFRQNYAPCEDRHFWISCGCVTSFTHVPDVVYRYRRRAGSHSSDRIKWAVASTRLQIDLVRAGGAQDIRFLDPSVTPAQLLNGALERALDKRNWKRLDALLELSDEISVGDMTTMKIKWQRRCKRIIGGLKSRLAFR